MSEFTHDFFFSYAKADRVWVEPVADRLKDRGFRVWAYGHEKFADKFAAINTAIDASRDFVLWVSDAYLKSGYCLREHSACTARSSLSMGKRRIYFAVLDEPGNQIVTYQWVMNENDPKYRDLLGKERPTPDQFDKAATWLTEHAAVDREEEQTSIPIPVAVFAMTEAEAAALPSSLNGPAAAYLHALTANLSSNPCAGYAPGRDAWRPFVWPENDQGWPTEAGALGPSDQDIRSRVEAAFREAGKESDARDYLQPGFRLWFCSDRVFHPEDGVRAQVLEELERLRGGVFIIDPVSLLHENLRKRLIRPFQVLDRSQCAFVVFPPVGVYGDTLTRQLHLLLGTFPEVEAWVAQYHRRADPLAEFLVTGFHGLRRSLLQIFPGVIGRWFPPPQRAANQPPPTGQATGGRR